MKIIQTLWLDNERNDSHLKSENGWISPEYNWMSSALSCLQFRKFYNQVELYANEPARKILIDKLNLPFTKFYDVSNYRMIAPHVWVLAKLNTYKLQKEPFLHADGDVFIWEKFNITNNSGLVAQNLEVNLPFYNYFLDQLQKTILKNYDIFDTDRSTPILACNAGVIGGYNLDFFENFYQEATSFIELNIDNLKNFDVGILSMAIEQLLFYNLATIKKIPIQFIIDNPIDDATYPGISDLHNIPIKQKFVHALGRYKKIKIVCDHLAKRLRLDYPIYYYLILKQCQDDGIELMNQVYKLPELSPQLHLSSYFRDLLESYLNGKLNQQNDWQYYYAKDISNYYLFDKFNKMAILEQLNQIFVVDRDCESVESYNPELELVLRVKDVFTLSTIDYKLDNLNIIIYDSFRVQKSVKLVLIELIDYFSKSEIEENYMQFQNLILDRIKDLFYLQSLYWVNTVNSNLSNNDK